LDRVCSTGGNNILASLYATGSQLLSQLGKQNY